MLCQINPFAWMMKVVFLLTGMSLVACNASPEDLGETPEQIGSVEHAVSFNGHDYLFVRTPKTWEEAQTYCQLRGYNLVTIDSDGEEQFLDLQESRQYNVSGTGWWIGYNDRGLESIWGWSSGSSTYTNWSSGQPNDSGTAGEDCAVDRDAMAASTWNDVACSLSNPFVCEKGSLSTTNNGSFSYTATNTNGASVNTVNRSVILYKDQVFTVGTCGLFGASGTGDTVLRINNPCNRSPGLGR